MRGAVTYAQSNEDKIYRQIKGAAAVMGVTQAELGETIGITQGGVSHAIKCKTLDVRQLCQIADRFGLEVRLCGR